MIVLAIDPGSERSGFVVYNSATQRLRAFGKIPNEELLAMLRDGVSIDLDAVVIEWTAPRGMPASAQLFETMWWAGRFAEAAVMNNPLLPAVDRLERMTVKRELCGKTNANDTNVRAALIDRFGGAGGKATAIGLKKSPGPLYGVSADVWAALGVAVVYTDLEAAR